MATVVLSYAGAALGTMLGGPIGGIIGRAIGGIAGNAIDQRVFGKTQRSVGPRLNDLRVMASEEGAAIPALWGRMRIAGQVIWSTNLEEVTKTQTQKASGKGGPKAKTTTYSYFGNFAVGLCEGEIEGIGRVWADGKLIDVSASTTRLYVGTETQLPDSLITTVEGAGAAPAYRGLAYIVFERMPLANFGNRIPQLAFEVFRKGSDLGEKIKAVNIIPGATEFGYDTQLVSRKPSRGKTITENAHASAVKSDWTVSMDQLQAACPTLESASLVVGWFGDDLRCGTCQIKPRVDNTTKVTKGGTWVVSEQTRATATAVTLHQGQPAYAGTPSDASVVRAIQDLRTRGLAVTFYPFIMMDIPQGNALPDPYCGTAQQAYPWRGRITASVAPGRAGTPDKTAAVVSQTNNFVGTVLPSHFTVVGSTVNYTGPVQWSYRRMILHYAKLCAAAGGVDAFLIGSEMRGLTGLRSTGNVFPFVQALKQLASEVKAILPTAKISYAADWSEYFGYQPPDGTGDVFFHLDPLWSDSSVDFIGIDNYMPLSDWRDGSVHADVAAGSAHDKTYLISRIAGGEGYDWFYPSQAARDAQARSPIADGAYGQAWVYRYKDLVNWWSNTHQDRPGGVRNETATAWVPQSKPIWFTEVGCPAVDKGANQPNVFYDAKSSESQLPYYSGGQRDDLMQNRLVAVVCDYWSTSGAHNPISSVYGQSMLRASRTAWWAWDARPFSQFPARVDVWSDGANYARGHWLNGRLGAVDLALLIKAIAARYGFSDVDVSAVNGLVDGFVLDRPMSARDALETLLSVFAIDAVETAGKLVFRHRQAAQKMPLARDALIDDARSGQVLSQTRAQEADLPQAIRMGYSETAVDYRNAAVRQELVGTASKREISFDLPAVISQSLAQARVDVALAESWAQRSTAQFALPPSLLALEHGDVLDLDGTAYRLQSIVDGEARAVEATLYDRSVYDAPVLVERSALPKLVNVYGDADVLLMDLAIATAAQPAAPWIAAQGKPWPGSLAVLRNVSDASYDFITSLGSQATMGETLSSLPAGMTGRVDYRSSLTVQLDYGALASASRLEMLGGANTAAVGSPETGFEIIQFERAVLIGAATYRLEGLLRGQSGSFVEMTTLRVAGARFVLLNDAVSLIGQTLAQSSVSSRWRIGPSSLDQAHDSYVELDLTSTLKALRPLRPAHVTMTRNAGGVVFNWIRQSRLGGDAWTEGDVPLGEDSESYLLQVMNGPLVKRSWTTTTPTQSYSNAEMTTDFGSVPSSFTLRVAQVSAVTGRGTFLERTLNG
jgi:hypothetical protein